MSDGSLNYRPSDAVKAIFGDEEARQHNDQAQTIAADVLAKAASGEWPDPPENYDDEGYDYCCLWTAALIVRFCTDRPGLITQSGDDIWNVIKNLKEASVLNGFGLSGYQWGWAVNTAKRVMETPPGPNPAIMTIPLDGGTD